MGVRRASCKTNRLYPEGWGEPSLLTSRVKKGHEGGGSWAVRGTCSVFPGQVRCSESRLGGLGRDLPPSPHRGVDPTSLLRHLEFDVPACRAPWIRRLPGRCRTGEGAWGGRVLSAKTYCSWSASLWIAAFDISVGCEGGVVITNETHHRGWRRPLQGP